MQFAGVAREKFSDIEARLEKETGVAISTDSGTVSNHGFTLKWLYDEQAQTLDVDCLRKPWWCPDSMVTNQLTALVTGA